MHLLVSYRADGSELQRTSSNYQRKRIKAKLQAAKTVAKAMTMISYAAILVALFVEFNVLRAHAQEQGPISDKSVSIALSQQEVDTIVSEHNRFRRLQNSSNIVELVWDDNLARNVAQNWSSRCYYDHPNWSNFAGFDESSLNDNLFVTSKWNLQLGLNLWYNEIADYDYETNSCKSGKVCGHYTAVVWHDSRKIGCALTFCPKLYDPDTSIYHNNIFYLMCSYSPPGNIAYQKPYLTGPTCSRCPKQAPWCKNGLCTPDPDDATCRLSCGCGQLEQKQCSCKCNDGWMGSSCSERCADFDARCSKYTFACQDHPQAALVREKCPSTCAVCVKSDEECRVNK